MSADLASLRIDRADPAKAPAWRRWIGWILVLGGGGAAAAKWLPSTIERGIFKPEVEVTEVTLLTPAQAAIELTATGHVTAQVVAKVGPKIQGRIAQVRVREGQAVKAGDVLFVLDPADEKSALGTAQARIEAARARARASEARLAEARVQYDREKALVDRGVHSPGAADESAARLSALEVESQAAAADIRVSQSEAGSVNQNLRNTTIVAPISGTAVTRPSQVGDVVGPTTTLVELCDFTSLLVEVDVPEARLDKVKVGGPAEVVLDSAPSERLRSEVAELSPRLDRSKATALARVRVTDRFDRLWPNMAARVSFLSRPLDAAAAKAPAKRVVPSTALVEKNGVRGLFTLEEDRVRWTPVSVVERLPTSVVLGDGPAAGVRLVDRPPPDLVDGRAVKIKHP
jgi:HlyD family secretion protein